MNDDARLTLITSHESITIRSARFVVRWNKRKVVVVFITQATFMHSYPQVITMFPKKILE